MAKSRGVTKPKKTKNKELAAPLEVKLSFETANALQAILTQQSVHAKREGNELLLEELDQVKNFYIHLTSYIEKHSK